MSQATQRAHLKSVLDSVSDIGQTYDYMKWAMHWSDVLAAFKTTIGGDDVIRGWTMEVRAMPSQSLDWELNQSALATALVVRTYRWVLRGVIGHNDADETEKIAAALAETVMNALDLDPTLHNQTTYYGDTPPCSGDVLELRHFGGVLCHYVEISQELQEVSGLREV